MLGILIPYASFHQFEKLQKENIAQFVKCPHKIYVVHSTVFYVPSLGHMANLNTLLDQAWEECDSFLLMDNDMIFLSDFHEPKEDCWFVPQKRENYTYAWPNLMYFKRHWLMRKIEFYQDSDSGGSSWRYLAAVSDKREILQDEEGFTAYQEEYEGLCKKYGVLKWIDHFTLNGSEIFHFRATSNWTKWPVEFIREKEELILHHVERFMRNMS